MFLWSVNCVRSVKNLLRKEWKSVWEKVNLQKVCIKVVVITGCYATTNKHTTIITVYFCGAVPDYFKWPFVALLPISTSSTAATICHLIYHLTVRHICLVGLPSWLSILLSLRQNVIYFFPFRDGLCVTLHHDRLCVTLYHTLPFLVPLLIRWNLATVHRLTDRGVFPVGAANC